MSYIRNRKHLSARPSLAPSSLAYSFIALAALGAPLLAQAQVHAQSAGAETRMPETTVTATADVPYKANKVSSPKLTQPLLDTTQTISVIKKELIAEQGASSIVDALRNTPGITLQMGENGNTSAGDTFQMRGFATQSSIFVDGVRDLGAVTRDAFNIEQIEVSKGPAGADIGRGAASGYINLASKNAQTDDFNTGTASINSASNKRITADVNRSLGATSALRLNVMAQDGGVTGRDHLKNSELGIAPSLALGLGTPTRVSLQSQHIRQDKLPDGGIPSIGLKGFYNGDAAVRAGARVDSHNFYGIDSDFEKVHADMLTVKVEHDLAGGSKLSNVSRYGKSNIDRILTGMNAITATAGSAPSTWTIARTRQSVLQDNEILANQTNLVTEFTLGGVAHTVSSGLEFMSEKQNAFGRSGLGIVNGNNTANLYKPGVNDAVTALAPVLNGVYTRGATTTAAAYAFDTVKLSEKFHLNGGLRVEHYNTEANSASLSTATSHPSLPVGTVVAAPYLKDSGKLVSWKAGALYKPVPEGSIYAAFATSKTPPGSSNFALSASAGNVNAPNMVPQTTRNVEIGTKWDVLGKTLAKTLALTAAVYRTENLNEISLLDAPTNTYSQLGKRRVQGLELGMVGQFTRNWQVTAGVATMKNKIVEGTTGANAAGAQVRWSPDVTATVWSSYKVNDKLTVGGGARYVSEQKRLIDPTLNAATQNVPQVDGYAVADAVLSYKVSKHVSLQLNVYNLFDKFYVNSLNNGGSRFTLGPKRFSQLSASIAF
ncbi:catecholate siderophore receptor Fiu [Massilia sp. TWP1-3-3]|uniref:catecholate siderophore receptor Fiu n=1 Tax=Massilia sp. TWP1-3-3 TaxID=2804573 RepID=UPI003CFB6281